MLALALALLAQTAAPAATDAKGIYGQRCAACHGEDGRAQTEKGRKLKATNFTRPRWQQHTSDEEIVEVVTKGIPRHKMPAFKDKLSGAEIETVSKYLRTFGQK